MCPYTTSGYNCGIMVKTSLRVLGNRKMKMLDRGTQDEKDQFARNLFNQYAKEIDTYDDFQKAVAFFIMNKCSYSGLTENSTFSRTASQL